MVQAAEQLVVTGSSRAVFVSPEGDEAAATAVLVAREVADTGLRVLLLDLTSNGAATRPMLDRLSYPGITNLLAAEAQFTNVIRADIYSDCHIIPVGTADAARAMRGVDRLPIIMESLTTAYDLVVVECGSTDAAGVQRLIGPATSIMVSVISVGGLEVHQAMARLTEAGYTPTLVSPLGYQAAAVTANQSAA